MMQYYHALIENTSCLAVFAPIAPGIQEVIARKCDDAAGISVPANDAHSPRIPRCWAWRHRILGLLADVLLAGACCHRVAEPRQDIGIPQLPSNEVHLCALILPILDAGSHATRSHNHWIREVLEGCWPQVHPFRLGFFYTAIPINCFQLLFGKVYEVVI